MLIVRLTGQSPRPHQERGRRQVDRRLSGAEGLYIIFVDRHFRRVVVSVISIEYLETVDTV